MAEISERYAFYRPKHDHKLSIERVLRSVPQRYLENLPHIILRDEASLTAAERGAGVERCRGVYYKKKGRRPARIELFIDNIMGEWPPWAERVPILREEIVYRILYHEIAHHLQANRLGKRTLPEDGAWRITNRLASYSFKRRRPFLVPLVRVMRWAVNMLRRARNCRPSRPTG